MAALMQRINFLHNHDSLQQSPDHEHVVVDRVDWEEARRIFSSKQKTFDFIVCLDSGTNMKLIADPLMEAGCGDGTIASCGDRVWIRFSREAESLEQAIKSAVADVRSAKCCTVTRVEIEV
jgi:hypothetical protein